MEEWKDIKGYEGLYQISNKGRVKSLAKEIITNNGYSVCTKKYGEKILKPQHNQKGYQQIGLHCDGKTSRKMIHRLVAEAFIPNPYNLPQVNHKDECKDNNVVENLEYCTNDYNHNYGTGIKRAADKNRNGKLSKKVYQYTLDGELVKVWESTQECFRHGFNRGNICRCCRNEYGGKTYKGYIWKYVE